MPSNKKEGIIFGLCMCIIMAFFMGLINISVHMGGFNKSTFLICLKAFPVTLIIVYIIETVLVGPISHQLLKQFTKESDSINAMILFNCFIIVTMMSFIMTFIGGLLGGDTFMTISKEFFVRWPRNFFCAFFLNILLAGPISRFVLRQIQE